VKGATELAKSDGAINQFLAPNSASAARSSVAADPVLCIIQADCVKTRVSLENGLAQSGLLRLTGV